MSRLVWSDRSRYDLLRLHRFLLLEDPDAASRAIATIRRDLQILIRNPKLGRVVDTLPERREWIISFGRAAYLALYAIQDDRIVILSLRHSREAGY